MSTQQDIYAAGSESRLLMLNKENYVPWSSRLLRYAKSRPNGKLIHNSILNGPYVRKMIPEPGDANSDITVTETFYLQTDDELFDKELKQIEADDQAIQTILLGLPKEIYAAIDSCETAQEIWLRPEWSRHVTIVHQTKDLHTTDYTQLYDFLKYNQKENYLQQPIPNPEDITDPTTAMNMALTLMAKAFKLNYSTPTNNNQRISSNLRNRQIAQPGMNMGQDRQMQMVGGNGGNQFRVQNVRNENGLIGVQGNGNQNQIGNGNLVATRAEGNVAGQNGNKIRCYNYKGVEEYDLMAAAADLDEIKEVNANCILMANLQKASTSEEQYTELLEPIPETHQVPQTDNDVISEDTSVEQGREIVKQHPANFEETHPTTTMNMALALMAKAFKLNYSTLTNNNQRISSNLRNRQIAQPGMNMGQDRQMQMVRGNGRNQFRQYAGQNAGNPVGYNDVIGNQKEEAGIQLQAEEYDLMAAAANLDEIEEVNANCILMANLQQASPSGTQTDSAPVYDTDGSAEVHENCDDNEIFNMFTQEEQYTELLEPIPESHQVLQNDNDVISEDTSVEQETVQLAQESRDKMKQMNKEIKPANYTKINHLSGLFKKVSDQKDNIQNSSANTKFAKQPIVENLPKVGKTNALLKPVNSNSDSTPQESKGVNNNKVIAPGMFRINPLKTSREETLVPNTVRASTRTKPITVSQPRVITTKDVNSDLNGLSSIGVENTKTRRPQPRSNTKNDRVPSAFKSSRSKNKEVEVEEHHRNLLLSKNNKHISSACNNLKIDSQDVISNVVCAKCKKCLISVNHDKCLSKNVNGKNSCGNKQKAKVSVKEIQKKYQPKVIQICLWCVDSSCSKHMTGNLKLLINFIWKFMGTVRFENDHVDTILGFSDLQWGNILITRVYFIKGLGHNLFSIGQFCDSDLEVAFRRDACFVRNIEGVDLLKRECSTNLYTINHHEMTYASPIFLMARASSTKSWLWHQRLSHLNFDTINDLARNDLVAGLPKFKYHKEHLCPSCEQGKSKRASHPPKPVPNSRQRLHLLHMDLCGPIRIASINRKRKPDISFLHVFGALCYPKNDREDIGKLGAKGDIGFFIGYSADSYAYRVYNRKTKKIIETMNVSFDELSAMAFEQRSSKPGLNSMTSRHISSGLDLTYALPDIVHATYQAKPTEKHPKEVKRIFRYLRGIVNTGLWYTKDSGFDLTGFSDADYAGCKDTFKSTSGRA
uniref:Integrase, catalytic region, zinc finger, CCHC-type, peptidase aspartic, catalytic n=1 Tax=Tanacetum cinerariifolium TaxID=118510 RepID=A0A6L2KIW9_TANCI|nr:integrase, catalytic region, zinc finger, CCHC-type, peptidase aspartic, catalytic [Tanacetum cinerariifolium]